MEILLYNPEIPPNTGNIARLCVGTNTCLHLVKPLGFSLEDKHLKRAALDYWPYVNLKVWKDIHEYMENDGKGKRFIMTSSKRGVALHRFEFLPDDVLFFGAETKGLPPDIVALSQFHVNIPTKSTVRSLNLATCAGIVLYQALAKSGTLDNWE